MTLFPQWWTLRYIVLALILLTTSFLVRSEEASLILTARQAASAVEAEVRGTVVNVEKAVLADKLVYRVRVVFDGHVKDFYVDAVSGMLLPDNEQE